MAEFSFTPRYSPPNALVGALALAIDTTYRDFYINKHRQMIARIRANRPAAKALGMNGLVADARMLASAARFRRVAATLPKAPRQTSRQP